MSLPCAIGTIRRPPRWPRRRSTRRACVVASHGFSVRPCRSLSVNQRNENAGRVAPPHAATAPGRAEAAAVGAVAGGDGDRVGASDAAVGRGLPGLVGVHLRSRPARRAAARARAGLRPVVGRRRAACERLLGVRPRPARSAPGSPRRSARRHAATASRAETRRVVVASTRSVTDHCHRGADAVLVLMGRPRVESGVRQGTAAREGRAGGPSLRRVRDGPRTPG